MVDKTNTEYLSVQKDKNAFNTISQKKNQPSSKLITINQLKIINNKKDLSKEEITKKIQGKLNEENFQIDQLFTVECNGDKGKKIKENHKIFHLEYRFSYANILKSFLNGNQQFINILNDEGKTPLHYAAKFKKEEEAKLLISMGKDINTKAKNKKTPLDYAQQNGEEFVKNLKNEYDKRQQELTTKDVQNAEPTERDSTSGKENNSPTLLLGPLPKETQPTIDHSSKQKKEHISRAIQNETLTNNLTNTICSINNPQNVQEIEEEPIKTLQNSTLVQKNDTTLLANDQQNVQEGPIERLPNSTLVQETIPTHNQQNLQKVEEMIEASLQNEMNVPSNTNTQEPNKVHALPATNRTNTQKFTENTTNAPLFAVTAAIVTMCILSLLTTIAISIASGILVGCVTGFVSSKLNSVECNELHEQHSK